MAWEESPGWAKQGFWQMQFKKQPSLGQWSSGGCQGWVAQQNICWKWCATATISGNSNLHSWHILCASINLGHSEPGKGLAFAQPGAWIESKEEVVWGKSRWRERRPGWFMCKDLCGINLFWEAYPIFSNPLPSILFTAGMGPGKTRKPISHWPCGPTSTKAVLGQLHPTGPCTWWAS